MVQESDEECLITVKVSPRASKNEISRTPSGEFKVKLTAPPVEGKANKALKRFLAERLGISRNRVEIVSGERARVKTLKIEGLSLKDIPRLIP